MLYQILLFSGQMVRLSIALSAIGNQGLLRRLAPVFKAGGHQEFPLTNL